MLPNRTGIRTKHYKDPNETTSIMEFFRGSILFWEAFEGDPL